MAHKAFITSLENISLKKIRGWFIGGWERNYFDSLSLTEKFDYYQNKRGNLIEQGLARSNKETRRGVYEFNVNGGPLIQLLGIIDNDYSASLTNSKFLNMRCLGNEEEIMKFVQDYEKYGGPGAPLKEVEIILGEQIGTYTQKELIKRINNGAVLEDDLLGNVQLADTTPYL